jgi:hypothetical protein
VAVSTSIFGRYGTVMLAVHQAGAVLVDIFDGEERFVGAIGVDDVLRAVMRRRTGKRWCLWAAFVLD